MDYCGSTSSSSCRTARLVAVLMVYSLVAVCSKSAELMLLVQATVELAEMVNDVPLMAELLTV